MANGKKGILAEFQEFISRGNVMDLAVGVIIGGAFTAIVNSLVTNVISPLISFITGGSTEVPGMAVSLGGNTVDFGAFGCHHQLLDYGSGRVCNRQVFECP